jgi:hypothetical protein
MVAGAPKSSTLQVCECSLGGSGDDCEVQQMHPRHLAGSSIFLCTSKVAFMTILWGGIACNTLVFREVDGRLPSRLFMLHECLCQTRNNDSIFVH